MLGGRVDGRKDIHKDFPSFSHSSEDRSKNTRPDNQAQSIVSIKILAHQTHFCGILKREEKVSENNGLTATPLITNYHCDWKVDHDKGYNFTTARLEL